VYFSTTKTSFFVAQFTVMMPNVSDKTVTFFCGFGGHYLLEHTVITKRKRGPIKPVK